MTHLLERAFSEASKLSELQQNVIAKWLIDEIDSEKRWDKTFAESEDLLGQLADEALTEFEQGKTRLLVPEEL